jgi:hypothetical protein
MLNPVPCLVSHGRIILLLQPLRNVFVQRHVVCLVPSSRRFGGSSNALFVYAFIAPVPRQPLSLSLGSWSEPNEPFVIGSASSWIYWARLKSISATSHDMRVPTLASYLSHRPVGDPALEIRVTPGPHQCAQPTGLRRSIGILSRVSPMTIIHLMACHCSGPGII